MDQVNGHHLNYCFFDHLDFAYIVIKSIDFSWNSIKIDMKSINLSIKLTCRAHSLWNPIHPSAQGAHAWTVRRDFRSTGDGRGVVMQIEARILGSTQLEIARSVTAYEFPCRCGERCRGNQKAGLLLYDFSACNNFCCHCVSSPRCDY